MIFHVIALDCSRETIVKNCLPNDTKWNNFESDDGLSFNSVSFFFHGMKLCPKPIFLSIKVHIFNYKQSFIIMWIDEKIKKIKKNE